MTRGQHRLAWSFLPIALAAAVAIALALAWKLGVSALPAWLIGVNVATALVYAYDKAVAGTGRSRVPERSLHALSAVGATPAAFISMRLLRHKTAKSDFQSRYWLITAGQAVLLVSYLTLRRLLSTAS